MTLRSPTRFVVPMLALAGFVLGACGDGDDSDKASGARTIEVEMRDIAFSPGQVDVRAGETVRFVFRNVGKIKHDAFIGDGAAQDEHEMEMREQDEPGSMEHGGKASQDESGIIIDPGETGEFTRTFQAGDRLLLGCHQPGHYAAGMKATIDVS